MNEQPLPEVNELLPHRSPMLHVDRILEMRENGCTAMKNISWNEPCFEGHFPDNPIFPGVLSIEALAQTSDLWMFHVVRPPVLPLFAGISNARFRRKVVPGDQLILDSNFVKEEKGFYTFSCTTKVGDAIACEATIVLAVRP